MVDLLQSGVGTDVKENSRLATIWFDSADPAVSAAIANSYVDNYIQTTCSASTTRRFTRGSFSRLAWRRPRCGWKNPSAR